MYPCGTLRVSPEKVNSDRRNGRTDKVLWCSVKLDTPRPLTPTTRHSHAQTLQEFWARGYDVEDLATMSGLPVQDVRLLLLLSRG